MRVEQIYETEKGWFGISSGGTTLTPNEWLALHTHPVLDVVFGAAYLLFIPAFVFFCAYYFFGCRDETTTSRAPRLVWSFFFVNILGYVTYFFFPAAPPWYYLKYGAGPAILNVPSDPAGAGRFDQLLGVSWFEQMYAHSANVFGAVPSLHVAYPLLVVLFSFRCGAGRPAALVFYGLMAGAAVYLNHHYVIDVIWGSFYALIVASLVDGLLEYKVSVHRKVEEEPNADRDQDLRGEVRSMKVLFENEDSASVQKNAES